MANKYKVPAKKTAYQISEFRDATYWDMNLLADKAYILSRRNPVLAENKPVELETYSRMESLIDYIKRRMRIRCRRFYGKLVYPHHVYGRGNSWKKGE